MENENENQSTEKNLRQRVQTTSRKVKKTSSFVKKLREILAVPILGKIILILLIILIVAFILVGTINFFHSMPNQSRDRLDEIIEYGVTTEEALNGGQGSGTVLTDMDTIIESAANDLVLKGYDIDGYGFLDPDEGDYVEQDETTGQVKSIQSKYIEAYIRASEATYKIAEGSSSDAVVRYSEDLILQIVSEGDPTAWVNKDDYNYFLEIVEQRVQSYLNSYSEISMEDLAQILSQTISDFNGNSTYMQIANSRGEVPKIKTTTPEQILAFMEENLNVEFADGLITFNESASDADVSIDRQNKQLIISVDGLIPQRNGEETVEGTHTYYYNLDGWLTKYARPYEFLLTLHLATMAPEFAYEVATSPKTNAKVVIGLKQTSVEMELVVDEEVSPTLSNPATTGTPQIAQKGEILALDQCYADMDFWYKQFDKSVNSYAQAKANALYEEQRDKIAEGKARAAATSTYKDKNGVLQTRFNQATYERVLDETKNNIDQKRVDIVNYIYDRTVNYGRVYWGLKGATSLIQYDSEGGTVKKEGEETGLSKDSDLIKGTTGDDDKTKKENEMYKWLEEFKKQFGDSFEENAKELDSIPLGQEQNSLSIVVSGVGEVKFDFTDYYAGEMNIDFGGIKVSESFCEELLNYWGTQGGNSGSAVQSALNTLAQIYANNPEVTTSKINAMLALIYDPNTDALDTCTYQMFNLGVTQEEYEHFTYIFQQIENLENLAKEIAALPSKVDFETYTPYIEKVTNHWFRNLTFRRVGTENLEGFDAYSEDEARTNYQYYTRYFRRSLDPLLTVYAKEPYGDPDKLYEQLGFTDCDQQTGYKYNVVELRYNAIEQVDNPRVTDNSAFIRSLITDEKYIIYDGQEKEEEQLIDDAKEYINVSKISVNSYAALEAMPDETSEILVRNLKELFKNTNLSQDEQIEEFSETHSLKPLSNIFPDYKPYTPWPNIWEQFEENNYTSMMLKNMNRAEGQDENGDRYHYLEAPTDCLIKEINGRNIEMVYRGVDGELYTLYCQLDEGRTSIAGLEFTTLVQAGDYVSAGANLAYMKVPSSEFNYQIQINLALKDNNNISLYVPDYMEVQQRELTAEEIITLHNFIMNEAAGQGYWGQAAIAAVVFNRIKYPIMYKSFVDCVDIFTTMDYSIVPPGSKNGSWNEKDLRTKLWGTERYQKLNHPAYGGAENVTRSILMAIASASRGFDPTKEGVPLGGTYYAIKDLEKSKYQGKEYTCELGSHVFYTEEGGTSQEDVFTNAYYEYDYRYDEDKWQRRFVLQLCITIKNSYYFENSDVLDNIIAWALMEQQENERREEEQGLSISLNNKDTNSEKY